MNEIPLYVGIVDDGLASVPEFWAHLQARAPMLAVALKVDGHAIVSRGVWSAIQEMPGFREEAMGGMPALITMPASTLAEKNSRRFDGLR